MQWVGEKAGGPTRESSPMALGRQRLERLSASRAPKAALWGVLLGPVWVSGEAGGPGGHARLAGPQVCVGWFSHTAQAQHHRPPGLQGHGQVRTDLRTEMHTCVTGRGLHLGSMSRIKMPPIQQTDPPLPAPDC